MTLMDTVFLAQAVVVLVGAVTFWWHGSWWWWWWLVVKMICTMMQVIYSLNTKNDDLEYDMEALRASYEDKLQKVGLDIC